MEAALRGAGFARLWASSLRVHEGRVTQVPSFEAKAASRVLSIRAEKTAVDVSTTGQVLLIASNVNGPGGIKGKWHEGGLSAASRVRCVDGPPALCSHLGGCSDIWIAPNKTCSVLNATHVTTDVVQVAADDTTATIELKFHPRHNPITAAAQAEQHKGQEGIST